MNEEALAHWRAVEPKTKQSLIRETSGGTVFLAQKVDVTSDDGDFRKSVSKSRYNCKSLTVLHLLTIK